jgi:hypothetical protein
MKGVWLVADGKLLYAHAIRLDASTGQEGLDENNPRPWSVLFQRDTLCQGKT